VTRLPSETNGAGLLRDTFGRRELTVRNLNDPLDIGDVPGVGTVFDGDGREQVVITGRGGTVLSVDGDAALLDLWKLGVRETNSATVNRDAILNAIAAVPASMGVDAVLPGGVIPLAPLTLPARVRTGLPAGRLTDAGGVLRGRGRAATMLTLPDGANTDMLTIGGQYWSLHSFGMDGNKENQTAGSLIRVPVPRTNIYDVYLSFAKEHCIVNEGAGSGATQTAHELRVADVELYGFDGNGLYVKGPYAPDFQGWGIWIGSGATDGLVIESPTPIVSNLHSWGCRDGLSLGGTGGGHGQFTGLYLEGNRRYNIFVLTRIGNKFSDGMIWQGGQAGIRVEGGTAVGSQTTFENLVVKDNVGPGVSLHNATDVKVTNCRFFDEQTPKTQTYGVFSDGTSDFNEIVHNPRLRSSDHLTAGLSLVGENNPIYKNDPAGGEYYIGTEAQPRAFRAAIAQTGPGRDVPVGDLSAANLGLTSGRLFLVGGQSAILPAFRTVNNVTFVCGTVAPGTPTNQWFAIVRRNDLAVLARTVDDTTTAWATSTPKTLAITGGYRPVKDEEVYLGLVVVAATMPNLRGYGSAVGVTQIAPILAGNSTTALTNPASLGATAAALTANGSMPFAYAS
jgi:hypothetical protein